MDYGEKLPLLPEGGEQEESGTAGEWGGGYEETSFGGGIVDPRGDTHVETPRRGINALSREIMGQKIDQIFDKLRVQGDAGANLDRFRVTSNAETGVSTLEFFNQYGKWVNLTDRRSGLPLAEKEIMKRFGGAAAMKNFLGLDETPDGLKRLTTEARRMYKETPTGIELQSMPNETIVATVDKIRREIAVNTDLDMREIQGLDKALQRMSGELKNNLSKLTEIDKHIALENGKLNEEGITEEQRQEILDRRKRLTEERDVRLELVSQTKKELSSQFARIKQTLEKLLKGDLKLGEKIRLLFREQGFTIAAVLTAIGLIIETIVQAFTGGGGRGASGTSPPKDGIKKWFQDKLKALARLLGKLGEKAAAALPGIIGAIVEALFNFLKKTVSFLAEHTWAVIVGILSFISYELYLYVGKKRH